MTTKQIGGLIAAFAIVTAAVWYQKHQNESVPPVASATQITPGQGIGSDDPSDTETSESRRNRKSANDGLHRGPIINPYATPVPEPVAKPAPPRVVAKATPTATPASKPQVVQKGPQSVPIGEYSNLDEGGLQPDTGLKTSRLETSQKGNKKSGGR